MNAFQVVKDFEKCVAEYAGSKYAVAVDSCTSAIFLSLLYHDVKGKELFIPKHTYVSVPCSILHAGGIIKFTDEVWSGVYQLKPYPIIDGAKRFRRNMYQRGAFHCLSFHMKKILNIGRGGMILLDDEKAVDWLKIMRYDGRHEVPLTQDNITMAGWNVYMMPEQAARGLWFMMNVKDHYEDLEETPDYPDMSQFEAFK